MQITRLTNFVTRILLCPDDESLKFTLNTTTMFNSIFTMIFLVVALISAILGFSGSAGTSSETAVAMFVIFSVLSAVSFFRTRGQRVF